MNIIKDSTGKISTGRIMSLILFLTVTIFWIWFKVTGGELALGDYDLIKWGWITALGGKALQTFGEKKG